MKILINTPDINKLGGVANHYKGLKKYWTFTVNYNTVGARKRIPGILLFPIDILKFAFKCLVNRPDVVILNPSLAQKAFVRDSLFLKISTFFKIKTFVFFHGWDKGFEMKVSQKPEEFNQKYGKATGFIVLANLFKQTLQGWGVTRPIYLTTTKVDDALLGDFSIEKKIYGQNILFLARIVIEKGLFIAIDAFDQLQKSFPGAQLTIVGSGPALEEAKRKAENNKNIVFLGALSGEKLRAQFLKADIYLFPTFHGEGMPTSLLEAMAFGLPIISRPVGGTPDFFESEKMGCLLESIEPSDFSRKIMNLLDDPKKMKEIGKYNHEYAKKHFIASKVALKMEDLVKNTNI